MRGERCSWWIRPWTAKNGWCGKWEGGTINITLIIDTFQREEENGGRSSVGLNCGEKCWRVAALNRSGGTWHRHGWLWQGWPPGGWGTPRSRACLLPFAPCHYSRLVRGLKLQRLLGLCQQKAGVLAGEMLHPCDGSGSTTLAWPKEILLPHSFSRYSPEMMLQWAACRYYPSFAPQISPASVPSWMVVRLLGFPRTRTASHGQEAPLGTGTSPYREPTLKRCCVDTWRSYTRAITRELLIPAAFPYPPYPYPAFTRTYACIYIGWGMPTLL